MNDRQLASGAPVPIDDSHKEIDPSTGMQKGYIVLTAEERAKGFLQPMRKTYVHKPCGQSTTMAPSIAETYARDPWFYSGTFCSSCCAHFDLSQFVWARDGGSMDPLLWTDEEMQRVAKLKASGR